jgi:hypothetical protein
VIQFDGAGAASARRALAAAAMLAVIAVAAGLAAPSSRGDGAAGPAQGSVAVELRPSVVRLGEPATLAVRGVHAGRVDVLLNGATDFSGGQLAWRSLRAVGGAWLGTLPLPALRGIYPIVLRADGREIRSERWLLRVFAPGTGSRPSFGEAADVARWWVRTIAGGMIVAVKAWPRPGFDRRDLRLHRLFVVAYSPLAQPGIDERSGMFVTAVRDGYRGRWRFLEATVSP